jgi:ribose transport system substrate-binding protein
VIDVVARALDVLAVFEAARGETDLAHLLKTTKLSRNALFRILTTLEHKGWIQKTGRRGQYRRSLRSKPIRVGYAMASSASPFTRDVTRGLLEAARESGVELLVRDNCRREEVAVLNARFFAAEKVDAVVEFQIHERIGPMIAHIFAEAGIPCVAIDIPQPGAFFYGANNYQAGLLAGRALARYSSEQFGRRPDKLLLLEERHAGPVPQARLAAALDGFQEVAGRIDLLDVIRLNGAGGFDASRKAVREIAPALCGGLRLAVTAINDPSAIGAMEALEEAGIGDRVVVIGQNGTVEARRQLRRRESRFFGSVAYFPETYGRSILALIRDQLNGIQPPPSVFTNHVFLDSDNVDQYYPASADVSEQPDPGVPVPA